MDKQKLEAFALEALKDIHTTFNGTVDGKELAAAVVAILEEYDKQKSAEAH